MNTSLITCASDILDDGFSEEDAHVRMPELQERLAAAAVFATMSAATAASSMAPAAFVDECVSWMSFW